MWTVFIIFVILLWTVYTILLIWSPRKPSNAFLDPFEAFLPVSLST